MGMHAEEQPLSVSALDGEVVLTGPRVAIALRPFAAAETAKRLADAAEIARHQAELGSAERAPRESSNDL